MAHNHSGPHGGEPIPILSIESHSLPTGDPREQLKYTVTCHSQRVHVIVTSKASVVRRWVQDCRDRRRTQLEQRCLVVGLGVQWAPLKDVDDSESQSDDQPPPATLQLCVGHSCLIYHLAHCDTRAPPALRNFLSDPNITFVGISNHRDGGILRDCRHRIEVTRLLDVRHVAAEYRGGSPDTSMEMLAEDVLGMHGLAEDEDVEKSDWDAECLSEDQVIYACLDAFIAFAVGKEIGAWTWGR